MADLRVRLLAERAQAVVAIAALERDLHTIIDATVAVATDDEHDPEGTTIAFERAQIAALLRQATERLADLDAALAREAEGRYGICERCGQPIPAERLAIRPAARRCVTCASRL